MARLTKVELERENLELRRKLYDIYDELGEFLEVGDDESADPGGEEEAEN